MKHLLAPLLTLALIGLTACGKQSRSQPRAASSAPSVSSNEIVSVQSFDSKVPEPVAAPAEPIEEPELAFAPAPEEKLIAKPLPAAPAPEEKPAPVAKPAAIPTPILAPAPMPTPAQAVAEEKEEEPEKALGPQTPNTPFSRYALFTLPAFNPNWGVRADLYERVVNFYNENRQRIHNPDYVIMVDFSKRSNEKRFFIFDLRKRNVIKLLTTHGQNSDPLNQGIATAFSNTENSLQSSLGFFLTMNSYEGLNGYSLRLRGLEATNSNAEKRGIVIHSAPYVNEELSRAGRSWGCLALDPKLSRTVINHIRGGALLYIGK